MKIAFISIASLALLQLGLVINILYLRARHSVYLGAPDDSEHPLFRARLAHSNAVEYAPILCILMLCLELYGHQLAFMPWVYGFTVAARYFHALGLVNFDPNKPNAFRAIGMGGTLLVMLGMTVSLLWQAGHGLFR